MLVALLMAVPAAALGSSPAATSPNGAHDSPALTVSPAAPPAAPRPLGGPANPCDGPYPPFAGLAPFPAGCVGRDQAIAGFYSNLAGGAGNVTLQLTLPIDRSALANQSDLYRAIWVGLVLNDPHAWMSQCFLEIRFRPDSSWSTGREGPRPRRTTGPGRSWGMRRTRPPPQSSRASSSRSPRPEAGPGPPSPSPAETN